MIFEDEQAENSMLNGDFDIAIPFRVRVSEGGDPEVTVFPSQKKLAQEFLRKFRTPDEIFTSEAIEWVRERIAPYLLDYLFGLIDEGRDYFLNFRITSADDKLILPETRLITRADELENLTGYDFDSMNEYGHICYGTVIDGKIVSAACTNYPCDLTGEDGLVAEIGTETAGEYRGRGYALSNCTALATALLERDFEVLYECEAHNDASVGLVKRLGGVEFAKNFCVVGCKLEDSEGGGTL